jgi:polyhydroxyalkanoate synthesis regulator phasin
VTDTESREYIQHSYQNEDTEELQEEIEELEQRIEDLTSFDSGASFHTKSGGGP